ncbi:MAG TPA: nickel pincer cofactor biosynthesis protein LarB [Gemmatimonadaceae bacterium]|nr:nickel pincer cofactor biosynthesis protein LarB [Gemmatimonadaceae bacterium]
MRRDRVRALLDQVAAGMLEIDDALAQLAFEPVESLSYASVDHHRALRHGYPEVVFAPGKTVQQVLGITERLAERGDGFLVTRAETEVRAALQERFADAEINELGRTVRLPGESPPPAGRGTVLIITAGTSDLPVAEEAAVTACALGNTVGRLTDVGVAGIHRLFGQRDALTGAAVIIVVAGMDGALPSVVGGLVSVPVIAVPTSVGYGASFGGISALLAMLNSCASGITVVNIDNGFGAAVAASRITHS